jgi:AcrR family transcriptional regulator
MSSTPTRLSAADRRLGILEAAVRVFADGSYRGVTTAEIAREAGVSEPILYRHFASKRDLYLAAVEHVWARVRSCWEEAAEETRDPQELVKKLARAKAHPTGAKFVLSELWIQALSEAGEDPELRKFLRRHLREVHGVLADGIRRAQAEGTMHPDRDADAEAWVFLGGGLLSAIGRRIGLLNEDDFTRIKAARLEWLTGAPVK